MLIANVIAARYFITFSADVSQGALRRIRKKQKCLLVTDLSIKFSCIIYLFVSIIIFVLHHKSLLVITYISIWFDVTYTRYRLQVIKSKV